MAKRRLAGWAIAFVVLFCVDQWVTDRLVEAHGEHWWTGIPGSVPFGIGLMLFINDLGLARGRSLGERLRSRFRSPRR